MEETIGYEAFFSPEEWDAIDMGGWSDGPDDGSPKGRPGSKHTVFIGYPPGQYQGDEERYELECDVCDYIGAADTFEEARALVRLHKEFVATLVDNWSVER